MTTPRIPLSRVAPDHAQLRVLEVADLERQVASLRRSVVSQSTIEQAKGLIMGVRGVDAGSACMVLNCVSRNTGIPVRNLALGIITSVDRGTTVAMDDAMNRAVAELLTRPRLAPRLLESRRDIAAS